VIEIYVGELVICATNLFVLGAGRADQVS